MVLVGLESHQLLRVHCDLSQRAILSSVGDRIRTKNSITYTDIINQERNCCSRLEVIEGFFSLWQRTSTSNKLRHATRFVFSLLVFSSLVLSSLVDLLWASSSLALSSLASSLWASTSGAPLWASMSLVSMSGFLKPGRNPRS